MISISYSHERQHRFACALDSASSAKTCVATAFVTKLKSDGSAFAYSTYLGGSLDEYPGLSMAVDASGNAYITGQTSSSTNFPLVSAFQPACSAAAVSTARKTGRVRCIALRVRPPPG